MLRPPLLAAALTLALAAPAAAAGIPASGWDIEVTVKGAYEYDQPPSGTPGSEDDVRRGSGTNVVRARAATVFLPRARGRTSRLFEGELRGRQRPGALTFQDNEERCTGVLAYGPGELVLPGRRHRVPRPKHATVFFDVTKQGFTLNFPLYEAWGECTDDDVGVPPVGGRRRPWVFPIPADAHRRRTLTFSATGWHTGVECGALPGEGDGPFPDGACDPDAIVRASISVRMTRVCLTTLRPEGWTCRPRN